MDKCSDFTDTQLFVENLGNGISELQLNKSEKGTDIEVSVCSFMKNFNKDSGLPLSVNVHQIYSERDILCTLLVLCTKARYLLTKHTKKNKQVY